MHLALFIEGIGPGGAERVVSTMANHWARAGRTISLITLEPAAQDFYPIDPAVERHAFRSFSRSQNVLEAVGRQLAATRFLRATLARVRPEVVIGFVDAGNLRLLAAARGLEIPTVISERIDPRHHRLAPGLGAARRLLYPTCDALVVQSHAVASWGARVVGRDKVYVIPNPVARRASGGARQPLVLAMGRLVRQKGFDLLIEAFARGAPAPWRLMILGEGRERAALLRQAAALKVADRVEMPGAVRDPQPLFERAGLFVLSSRYEGFPNALCEAMAAGVPVISTDCPSGPAEIVRDGVDGLLVPPGRSDVLTGALARLIGAPEIRTELGRRAIEVSERFGTARVMAAWERVCEKAAVRAQAG